jgi:16S rRNA (adenine1518-N6/adenine1519-N6)-dimethyltransferase
MRAPRPARPPLRRSYGQHHLRDGAVCRPLVDFLRLAAGDGVLEIGAGGGVLTRELLARGARVAAVELDAEWAVALAGRLSGAPGRERCAIVVADALTLDWSRLPVAWRVAGNLPYNVGTAIVERLLAAAPAGLRAAFLLQREVVDRMTAGPGDDAYGALSLLVAARARAERLGVVRPGAFVPPPRVDSAFVGLETVPPLLPHSAMGELERLIRIAFAQRRKSLRNALAAGYGRAAADSALAAAGIAPARRAEELGLRDFLALRAALSGVAGSR